ncbi:hypothetical protein CSKR_101050 [Clonorchis sinensis]|uniref:Uncharacterized protein n=1 Tax=Clonorchis sinensis TaxID=79923 RepID=A0A419QI00_CLOSI|nr:hypothetical protein CSKR_101050 [Clonorchis sinensis]
MMTQQKHCLGRRDALTSSCDGPHSRDSLRHCQKNHIKATINEYPIRKGSFCPVDQYNAHPSISSCSGHCITRATQPRPGRERGDSQFDNNTCALHPYGKRENVRRKASAAACFRLPAQLMAPRDSRCHEFICICPIHGCPRAGRWHKWLEREFIDRKVRGSNPTSASRLPLSRLRQPGSIPALVLPSGVMAIGGRFGSSTSLWLKSLTTRQWCLAGNESPHMLQPPTFRVRRLCWSDS